MKKRIRIFTSFEEFEYEYSNVLSYACPIRNSFKKNGFIVMVGVGGGWCSSQPNQCNSSSCSDFEECKKAFYKFSREKKLERILNEKK